jgi:mannose-6-phosphate isomerase-like protein (cupin superfamily)
MITRTLLLLFLVLAVALPAGVPGFVHWTAKDIQGYNSSLAAKMKGASVASETIGEWNNHRSMIARRNADGEAELHEHDVDFFVAEAGEATLVVGGNMRGPHITGPGEVRGTGIDGGDRVTMKVGDIVHIPANVPHQLLVKKEFLYYVIKVRQ